MLDPKRPIREGDITRWVHSMTSSALSRIDYGTVSLSALQVDDHQIFGWHLVGKLRRFRTAENVINIAGIAVKYVSEISSSALAPLERQESADMQDAFRNLFDVRPASRAQSRH